jgi:cytochrome b561
MYWIITLLALAALGLGWSLDYFAEGSRSVEIASLLRIVPGVGLATLVAIVPIWRRCAPTPDFSSDRPQWLQISPWVSASLVFILLVVSAVTGYLGRAFSGGAAPE